VDVKDRDGEGRRTAVEDVASCLKPDCGDATCKFARKPVGEDPTVGMARDEDLGRVNGIADAE
jgi:hypothetical protein